MREGGRRAILVVASVLSLLLLSEVALRTVYFQRTSRDLTCIGFTVRTLRVRVARWRAERAVRHTVEEMGVAEGGDLLTDSVRAKLHTGLYGPKGKELLAAFRRTYAMYFEQFVQQTRAADTRLLVVYLPSDDYADGALYRRDSCRAFYRELCARHEVTFVDLTDACLPYPVKQVTLLPQNGHFSRFGNQLVAAALEQHLESLREVRSSRAYDRRPDLLGDLSPSMNEIWTIVPEMPYRVISNSQGLRMARDLDFPKSKQRILALGDSYTFGPYLDNHDCWPDLLDAADSDRDVVNAGVAGYTIVNELELFVERARFVEPDVTILQVLDNDIIDLFYFKQDAFDRKGRRHTPTPEEIRFIRALQAEE